MAAGVTSEQIYETLLANGYSSVQAFGIMGNMICESSLDPEEVNPGGPPDGVGLCQWQTTDYPDAAGLVTGNPVQDMGNQIRFLVQHAVTAPNSVAASGSTGAEVAGNWAVDFEKCGACSPTGSYGLPPSSPGGYNDRVANAATVESWASSGNWPGGPTGSVPPAPAPSVPTNQEDEYQMELKTGKGAMDVMRFPVFPSYLFLFTDIGGTGGGPTTIRVAFHGTGSNWLVQEVTLTAAAPSAILPLPADAYDGVSLVRNDDGPVVAASWR